MWRGALFVFAVAACGRIDFDELGEPGFAPTATHSQLTLAPPAEAMVDFPVLVVLDDTRANRVEIGDASTLRFLDDNGAVLPHEIERVGAPGAEPLVAWVRVQVPTTGATIYAEYGPGVPAASTQSVWSSDFDTVWHFAADGTVVDSTGNGLDLTALGTHTGDAVAGRGVELDGVSTQYLVASATTPAFSEFTVSAFMWTRTVAGTFQGGITRQFDVGDNNELYLGLFGNTAVATCEAGFSERQLYGARQLDVQTWYYVTATVTQASGIVYVDGVLDTTTMINAAPQWSAHSTFVGANRDASTGAENAPDNDFFNGIIDEARIQNVARSAAWVDYDARAVRDQVVTYGPVIEPSEP